MIIDNRPRQDSWNLAVAVGLAAAAAQVELPPWVAFSGCLPTTLDRSLSLVRTNHIAEKVRLCLGEEASYDGRAIFRSQQGHALTERYLGPTNRRIVSGQVQLLLTGLDVQGWDDVHREQLGANFLHDAQSQLRAESVEELRTRIEDLVGNDLLLMQVPSVHEVLWLLRLRRQGPPGGWNSCRLFQVPHSPRPLSPEAERAYREARASEVIPELERRFENIPDTLGRLKALVGLAAQVLRCDDGNVRRIGSNPGWLECVATWGGHAMGDVLRFVPADQGINGKAFTDGQRVLVENGEAVRGLSRVDPVSLTELERLHGQNQLECYQKLVEGIGSCAAFPLFLGSRVVGVLSLHRPEQRKFDPGSILAVEKLAERAAWLIDPLLQHELAMDQFNRPSLSRGELEQLVRRLQTLELEQAIEHLRQHLANHFRLSS
jgi:hypothetical protein